MLLTIVMWMFLSLPDVCCSLSLNVVCVCPCSFCLCVLELFVCIVLCVAVRSWCARVVSWAPRVVRLRSVCSCWFCSLMRCQSIYIYVCSMRVCRRVLPVSPPVVSAGSTFVRWCRLSEFVHNCSCVVVVVACPCLSLLLQTCLFPLVCYGCLCCVFLCEYVNACACTLRLCRIRIFSVFMCCLHCNHACCM